MSPPVCSSAWGGKLKVYSSLWWTFLALSQKDTRETDSLTTRENQAEKRGSAQALPC